MIALPTNRDENWRYANLRALARAVTEPVTGAMDVPPSLPLPPALPGFDRWVFIDGVFAPSLSRRTRDGAMLVARGDAQESDAFERLLDVELASAGVDFALARVNLAHGNQVLVVNPPADGGPLCLELDFLASQGAKVGTSYPRVQVHAARGTQLHLVERHLSAGTADSIVNAAVDIGLAPGARVEHVRLQNLAETAAAFDTLAVNVGERAHYTLRTITLGGQSARTTAFVRLAGRGARCDYSAASIANGTQTLDGFVEIVHAAPEAATRQVYRGIATERGRLGFNGRMVVAGTAIDADSDQSLKTLLTGTGAEAAVRPQLEIYTDRVRAKHGATTGKLDDHMLFYLLSRGIDRVTAQALLQWAFIEDTVAHVAPAPLRGEIERLIAEQLLDVKALDGLVKAS